MELYYVNMNAQSNGDHEVHKDGCSFMPDVDNRKYLGAYSGCSSAVKESKKTYPQSNGCYYCCFPCHTS